MLAISIHRLENRSDFFDLQQRLSRKVQNGRRLNSRQPSIGGRFRPIELRLKTPTG